MSKQTAPKHDDINLRATALKMAMEAGTSQGMFGSVKSESPAKHVARAAAYYDFLTGADKAAYPTEE